MVLDQIEAELEKRKLEYQGRHWAVFMGLRCTPDTAKSFVSDEQLPWNNHWWVWGCHWALLVWSTLVLCSHGLTDLWQTTPALLATGDSRTPVLMGALWEP